MWPFSRNQPEEPSEPTASALAIAKSIEMEPQRWGIGDKRHLLVHRESRIAVDTEEGWIVQPWSTDEPDANAPIIRAAVDKWIIARLAMPVLAQPTE